MRGEQVATGNSILLLLGDAEARLLADADVAIQAVFMGAEVELARAWATRTDWLVAGSPGVPRTLVERGLLPDIDLPAQMQARHRLVVIPLWPAVSTPAWRHRDGGAFLAHRSLLSGWGPETEAAVRAECTELPPMTPAAAAAALEPHIERLLADGVAVALCTAFRHVEEPLSFRLAAGRSTLREAVRRTNLEVVQLSRRTGCFVLDVDRPFAQEGGEALQADCFGGGERAAEIALDEFAAMVVEALPDGFPMPEVG
jgi:hypothetical protein